MTVIRGLLWPGGKLETLLETAFAILATFGFQLLAAVIRGLQRPAGKLVSSQRSQNSNQKLRAGGGVVSLFHFHNSDTTVCPFVQSQFQG